MSFWGVEVKPGKPYTHLYDNSRGRLRISQASLGNGKSDKNNKSVVQCNVGNKSPIILCHLIPGVSETLHLELEFEEEGEDVVFSVIGQRSVHLSGYYLVGGGGKGPRNFDGDETDSYGEDIGESDDSGSYDTSTEDEYESDFIDDDVEMFPPSPRRKSGVIIEEIIEDEKPSNTNSNRRRLKKKHQLSDSDDDDVGSPRQLVKHNSSAALESEDEDGFPVIFSSRRKKASNDSERNSKSDDKTTDEDRKRKIDAVSQDGGAILDSAGNESLPSETGAGNNEKSTKKKKTRDGKSLESGTNISAEEKVCGGELKQQQAAKEKVQLEEPKAKINGDEVDESNNDVKSKKKEKRAKKGKKSEAGVDASIEGIDKEAKENPIEAVIIDNMDQDALISEQEKSHIDNQMVDPPAIVQETSGKLKKNTKKKKGTKENSHESKLPAEAKVDTDENKLQNSEATDKGPDADLGEGAAASQTDLKKKKKKNKKNKKDPTSIQEIEAEVKSDELKAGPKTQTFPNGLVIEDLAMGKPDGQRASPGKKVSVNYIGKLKNGTIFDSSVGRRPFKFRLGVGQVIKGWDIGVKGMRVGDKRRLTVPPSFGYGARATGQIPANSWLVFDVELVAVE